MHLQRRGAAQCRKLEEAVRRSSRRWENCADGRATSRRCCPSFCDRSRLQVEHRRRARRRAASGSSHFREVGDVNRFLHTPGESGDSSHSKTIQASQLTDL